MLPGDDLEEILHEFIYNPEGLTKEFRYLGYFFPSNEEIVKTLSLVESGNLQMLDPKEIDEILKLSKNCEKKILSFASFAFHGVLQEVTELILCNKDNGFATPSGPYYASLDLGFVPSEHLQALVPCVTEIIEIRSVTGCDVTSLLDSVNCTKLHLTQKMNKEETDALVRAMAARVDDVYLGGSGNINLDVDTLTQYKGDGKCRAIHCIAIGIHEHGRSQHQYNGLM